MNYLLDTHALLWAIFEPDKISAEIQALIRDPRNEICVSTISFWEISLKYALGKLSLVNCQPEDLPGVAEEMGLAVIAPDAGECAAFWRLPRLTHKDPFDRMLVWLAMQRQLCLITKDGRLPEYRELGLRTVW